MFAWLTTNTSRASGRPIWDSLYLEGYLVHFTQLFCTLCTFYIRNIAFIPRFREHSWGCHWYIDEKLICNRHSSLSQLIKPTSWNIYFSIFFVPPTFHRLKLRFDPLQRSRPNLNTLIHAQIVEIMFRISHYSYRKKKKKKKKREHKVSLLMNNAAFMNLLPANRWSPRPRAAFLLPERPSVVTRNRIFLRFYLYAESFHANRRFRSMRACKTRGGASRRSDPRTKIIPCLTNVRNNPKISVATSCGAFSRHFSF